MIVIFSGDGGIVIRGDVDTGVVACESCGAPLILNTDGPQPVFEEPTCLCFVEGSRASECSQRIVHTPERCQAMRGPRPPLVM
jgi:hypothetical protein